jgi:hypothetical protein
MHIIYWLDTTVSDKPEPRFKEFEHTQLIEALEFSSELRKQRKSGAAISYITSCTEDPNCVGEMGVDVTGPDYDWKKRR